MTSRIRSWAGSIAVFTLAIGMSWGVRADSLPARLSDAQFWSLSAHLSELGGTFRSDNLLSNELGMQAVIPELLRVSKPAACTSASAPNRTSPTSRRCGRRWRSSSTCGGEISTCNHVQGVVRSLGRSCGVRGASVLASAAEGLDASSSAAAIFGALQAMARQRNAYRSNLHAVLDNLTRAHKLALLPEDVSGIGEVYHAFYQIRPVDSIFVERPFRRPQSADVCGADGRCRRRRHSARSSATEDPSRSSSSSKRAT